MEAESRPVPGAVAVLVVTACAGAGHPAAGSARTAAASAQPAQGTIAATLVTDPNGVACIKLGSNGYCPYDVPQVTDPNGHACSALDGNGYCPGDSFRPP